MVRGRGVDWGGGEEDEEESGGMAQKTDTFVYTRHSQSAHPSWQARKRADKHKADKDLSGASVYMYDPPQCDAQNMRTPRTRRRIVRNSSESWWLCRGQSVNFDWGHKLMSILDDLFGRQVA